jgi:hypothetical protein
MIGWYILIFIAMFSLGWLVSSVRILDRRTKHLRYLGERNLHYNQLLWGNRDDETNGKTETKVPS